MAQNENQKCEFGSIKDLCKGVRKLGLSASGPEAPPLSDRITGANGLILLSQSLEGICFVSLGHVLSIEEEILPL